MPQTGYSAKNIIKAGSMLEYCRFIYKAYAQSCINPLDPFYESYPGVEWSATSTDARDRIMRAQHNTWKTAPVTEDLDKSPPHDSQRKFDPVWYRLDQAPNPQRGVLYRDGVDDQYVIFLPRELDRKITYAVGFDLSGGRQNPSLDLKTPGLRCCYFQGKTGGTETHPTLGWPSWLGAVLYDAEKRSA